MRSTLDQIMTWDRTDDKSLSGLMMAQFADVYMRHSSNNMQHNLQYMIYPWCRMHENGCTDSLWYIIWTCYIGARTKWSIFRRHQKHLLEKKNMPILISIWWLTSTTPCGLARYRLLNRTSMELTIKTVSCRHLIPPVATNRPIFNWPDVDKQESFLWLFTIWPFRPKGYFRCLCLSVCPSVCSLILLCPHDTSWLIWARNPKFALNMHHGLLSVGIADGGRWPWSSRTFMPFWLRILGNSVCLHDN